MSSLTDFAGLRMLELKLESLRGQLHSLGQPTPATIRMHNQLTTDIAGLDTRIRRQQQCRSVYTRLDRPPRQQQQHQQHTNATHATAPTLMTTLTTTSTTTTTTQSECKLRLFVRDLMLPRPTAPQDTRTQIFIDYCRCGATMMRHPTMSYTVCPVCFCKRIEIDMCARDLSSMATSESASSKTAGLVRHRPATVRPVARNPATAGSGGVKQASHYGSFLNSKSQRKGRRMRTYNPERLRELCKFCYVEGARHPSDINTKIINQAQQYLGGPIEYPLTPTYLALLRDNRVVLPPSVKARLIELYAYVHPVYSQLHDSTAKKRNMPKFPFVTRILCRLLGLDVFVGLFDKFSMSNSIIRRTWTMRRVFQQLGWTWTDDLAEEGINSALLDAYDVVQRAGHVDDDDDSDDEDEDDDDDA